MTTPDIQMIVNFPLSMIDVPSTDLIEVCRVDGKIPAKRGKESSDNNAILRIAILYIDIKVIIHLI
jgi:hypothetical protein